MSSTIKRHFEFSTAPLEADSLLWGSFWQGDVISAGYTLPALELCFLRESRLTKTTTAATPQAFAAQIRHHLQKKPQTRRDEKLCGQTVQRIFSAGWTVWLAGETIIAGYGSPQLSAPLRAYVTWVAEQLPLWGETWASLSPAAQLDHAVQAQRAHGLLRSAEQSAVAHWLENVR